MKTPFRCVDCGTLSVFMHGTRDQWTWRGQCTDCWFDLRDDGVRVMGVKPEAGFSCLLLILVGYGVALALALLVVLALSFR